MLLSSIIYPTLLELFPNSTPEPNNALGSFLYDFHPFTEVSLKQGASRFAVVTCV
jgi:hypothetical protein